MPESLRIAYFAHALRSDWNNGNAHFLRGLLRALGTLGHQVTAFEPAFEWSMKNLLQEADGLRSLAHFEEIYADLRICDYVAESAGDAHAVEALLRRNGVPDVVILHEWNAPALAGSLLGVREALGFKLLFHDTHHRASSSPESFSGLGLDRFDGILAFGESLRTIYRTRFGLERVWTFHEAADTTVFRLMPEVQRAHSAVWIGNWGEGERSGEIDEFFLKSAAELQREAAFTVHGVRYPPDGLAALARAHVRYAGYLPNLDAPAAYARAALTVHIPRQQYSSAMLGIPTIRVFEALACGIPLISAPWQDTEELFREGDYLRVANAAQMTEAMRHLLGDREAAEAQAARGLETVLARHTCGHRARQLTAICREVCL